MFTKVNRLNKGENISYNGTYETKKYTNIGIVRVRRPTSVIKNVLEITAEVYKIVGCKGFARVDFIIKNGKPYLLEINTISGLTTNSLLPKEAKAAGIGYPELLDKIIQLALE